MPNLEQYMKSILFANCPEVPMKTRAERTKVDLLDRKFRDLIDNFVNSIIARMPNTSL